MSDDRVFALILAAGMSQRLGRPKQLLELDGKPLVAHVVEKSLASPVEGTVVVVGSHASEVELMLRNYRIYRVFNPHFAQGQGSTLASGIRALPSSVAAVVVLLADMPGVQPDAISAVIDRWRQTGAPAVVANYGEGQGHPVLFDRSVFTDLGRLEGESAGREILASLGDLVELVDVPFSAPPLDVDTEQDWERMQAEWSQGESQRD